MACLSTGLSGQDKTTPLPRLELELVDGSRLIGTSSLESVPVQTSLAMVEIRLKLLQTLKLGDDHQSVSLDLRNGDKVKGVIKLEPIQLETVFGKVSVHMEHLRALRVRSLGGELPAGEGPLVFGGLNWTPWRTGFEVRDDKLVSLAKARPGFNYGHGGNGRGATLVTNVGSADWKDYRVEFELGMNGVDPAFNPHGLALDFRSASILFHIADGKESWNERGGSCYGLNFGGDGTWSLTCAYNSYCNVPCGYGNPTSDGNRTLAQGKGLTHDPLTGNKILLEVRGTNIRIRVDDEPIVDLHDDKMGQTLGGQTLDHGGIGFIWGFESMGWIRNFSATPL